MDREVMAQPERRDDSDLTDQKKKRIKTLSKGAKGRSKLQPSFCLVFLVLGVSFCLREPETTTVPKKKFIRIYNTEINRDPSLFTMAVTEDGELYSIPKNIQNLAKYAFKKNGRDETYKVKSAEYLSKDHVFLLHNDGSEVYYQLFKTSEKNKRLLNAVPGESNTGKLLDTLIEGSKPHVLTHPIKNSANRLIVSVVKGLRIMRFEAKEEQLAEFETFDLSNIQFEVEEMVYNDGFIQYYGGDEYFLVLKELQISSGKSNIVVLGLKLSGEQHKTSSSIWLISRLFGGSQASRALISPPGIRYRPGVLNGAEWQKWFPYILDNRIHCVRVENGKLSNEWSRIEPGDYFYSDIKTIPNTEIFVVLGQSKRYEPGKPWTSKDHSRLFFYRNLVRPPPASIEKDSLYTVDFTDIPYGEFLAVSEEGFGTIVAPWHESPNVMYLEELLNTRCPRGKSVVHKWRLNQYACQDTDRVRTNCRRAAAYTQSCLECNYPSNEVSYKLVASPTWERPGWKSCEPENLNCPTGKEVDTDSQGCYDCSSIAGCTHCFGHYKQCKVCNKGFGIDFWTSGCQECGIRKCTRCIQEGNEDKMLCQACEDEFALIGGICQICQAQNCRKCNANQICTECMRGYLWSGEESFSSCVQYCPVGKTPVGDVCKPCAHKGNPFCSKCQEGTIKCTQCPDGYLLNSQNFCQVVSCPAGEYRNGLKCAKCSSLNDNKWCSECEFKTGACNKCASGFTMSTDGQRFCRVKCEENEFWNGKTQNKCMSCALSSKNCQTCSDPVGRCLTCQEGFHLTKEKNCITESDCPSGSYMKRTEEEFYGKKLVECEVCSALEKNGACEQCSGFDGVCSKCLEGYLMTKDKRCINENDCSEDSYLKTVLVGGNKVLVECELCTVPERNGECSACRGEKSPECTKCKEGYFLNSEKRCFKDCPVGSYLKISEQGEGGQNSQNSNKIASCEKCGTLENNGQCAECLGGETPLCTKCNQGYELNQDKNCISAADCPVGTFF